ncbi:hypothetical protein VTI28DRAFT_8519 [Corynascus sepedonium]
MNICPAPDSTSVAYFTGSYSASADLDNTGFCPVAPVCEDCSSPIFDVLRGTGVILASMYRLVRLCLMDLEPQDIARYVGKALGILALMLAVIAAPIFWVIEKSFGIFRIVCSTIFSGVYSVLYGILRIVISPFLIPWHIVVWTWEMVQDLYDELEPLLIYFSFAVIIGAFTGTIIAILTNRILRLLHSWFPFLRPRRSQRPVALSHNRAGSRGSESHRSNEYGRSSKDKNMRKDKGKDKHVDSAIYWSSSDDGSDTRKSSSMSSAPGGGSWRRVTPPTAAASSLMAKSSRYRTPPVGVRVEDTIHEESSGEKGFD